MQPTEPYRPQPAKQPPGFRVLLESLVGRLRGEFDDEGFGPIERLVAEAPKSDQAAVFEALVIEEIQLRKKQGATPTREEYLQRFPDRAALVANAWRRLAAAASNSTIDDGIDPSDSEVLEFEAEVPKFEAEVNEDTEPTQLGPYKVLCLLGSGTFGSVYQAQHESTGDVVAIKMLKKRWARDPDCGNAMRLQFAEEAKRMLQFDHPHVVRVISLDERTDPPYFVQQYIDGSTLADRLLANRLTIEQSIEYAIQIADGLTHIHSHECWHRDLKPANILLDRDNHVYLADFGLALEDAERWRSATEVAGTFPYMAPEQIRGALHRLNARCDIWALGVILYEMLTGKRPFRGQERELREDVATRTPSAPRELNQRVPRELNRLCMQCLAKDDANRPHAAADVRDDLVQILQSLKQSVATDSASVMSERSTTNDRSHTSESFAEYPFPALKRFTAEQAELYLRMMPRGYTTEEELPELISFWKTRITQSDPDQTFAIGIMVGVSGCGKSSMLEAGLVPALPESIIPILIEASETDTEVRILNKLRRALPDADPDQKWSLVDWTFRIRRGTVVPSGKKVVFILDQFEQWLNAHGGEASNPLLDALHQCDGENLQTICCVREGFHATLMRFVEALNVNLDDHRNYATAHRFTADHARFVLTQFGRGLKRVDEPATSQQQAFIDATVDGLAESDRGVVCVRLVVLALVMQDRPWSVEELDQLGGLDGIGSQFLIDCFEGRTASEQYRRYLPAAMRVLADLLPAQGLEIKDVRSYQQLLSASELEKRQFDDLLNILVRKLFLLTPVEPVAASASSSLSSSSTVAPTSDLYYQLTHDFLVPSIRDWLSRKLRESKAGRAQLRLQEATAAWTAKSVNRNLPSMWEWLRIRRFTDASKWKAGEKALMQRATRYHAQRFGLATTAVVMLVCAGTFAWREVARRQEATRIEGLVNGLVVAGPGDIAAFVKQLDANPKVADQFLSQKLTVEGKTIDDQRTRLHARLASVSRDPSLVEPLVEELLTAKPTYVIPIREILSPYASQVADQLSTVFRNEKAEPKQRFQAALVLADYIPEAQANWWTDQDLMFVAQQLVSENSEYQPIFRDALRPIRENLLGELERIFGNVDFSDSQRLSAANALADYAAEDRRRLTRLLTVATTEQFKVLYPVLNQLESASPSAETIADLNEVAATLPPEDLGSVPRIAYGQRRANAAVTMLKFGEKEKVLSVFDWTDDPEALTQFIFRCKPRDVAIETLLDLLDVVIATGPDHFPKDTRYALLLAIGEYGPAEIPMERRAALVKQLADWYANDPSSGVHGASGWLLRVLGEQEIADRVDQTVVPYDAAREWFTLAIEVQPSKSEGLLSFLQKTPTKKTFYYTFIVYPARDYMIGAVEGEPDQRKDEIRHTVTLTRPFALLDRELTFDELIAFSPRYLDFMGQLDAAPTDASSAVDWYDSVAFCRWLGKEMGLSETDQCYPDPEALDEKQYPRDPSAPSFPQNWPLDSSKRGFRLPTESEWEVAARNGSRTAYGFGSEVELLDRFGWFAENSGKRVHAVREKHPSIRGLFDLHGNLVEWTHDWDGGFGSSGQNDPLGAKSGLNRVSRGGSWILVAAHCRSAYRGWYSPEFRSGSIGFRVALVPVAEAELQTRKTAGGQE